MLWQSSRPLTDQQIIVTWSPATVCWLMILALIAFPCYRTWLTGHDHPCTFPPETSKQCPTAWPKQWWITMTQIYWIHGNAVTLSSIPINPHLKICLLQWGWCRGKERGESRLLCICAVLHDEDFEVDWAWWMLINDTVRPKLHTELVT